MLHRPTEGKRIPMRVPRTRTQDYRWSSREELYEYFHEKYGLTATQVDEAVVQAQNGFRPRSAEPIQLEQLWEKTGRMLERRRMALDTKYNSVLDELDKRDD